MPKDPQKSARSAPETFRLAKINSHAGLVAARAQQWVDEFTLFLDMLTTGQGKYAQAVEIALVNIAGEIVFENRLKPTVSVEETAAAVHGIRSQQLLTAPVWPQTSEELQQLMDSRTIVIFGAELDIRLLRQTTAANKDAALWLDASDIHCAMRLAAP
ncbi:hypothetical protein OD522_004891 [Salmonella enterica]|nr:hypothetical protein [Salmonella enterica]EJA5857504.1 hypothetical protein [Salmonella enterica]EJF5731575.1 hypothetical protein [Salmonella enterica]EJU3354141.1 hypothetical protein [Salmonella enterica]EJX4304650.1 hypothetical protein [Salmonella enterica]